MPGEKPTGQTIRLPDRKAFTRPKNKDQSDLDVVAYLALKYPQYTLKQLYEEVPAKWFPFMIRAAKRDEAEKFLLLNNIINGPNAKDKSKKAYRKTIDTLQSLLE